MVEPPFTEPVPVPCLFVSGAECEFFPGFVRIYVWTDLPSAPGEGRERRIEGRWVMPDIAARALLGHLQRGLRRRSN